MSCKVGNQTNSQDPQAVNSRVFVGNLNTFQCSKTDVERMFQRYGRIAGISMHKGYAFIQFTNPFDARSACLGEDGRLLWGQTLDVNMVAEPKAHQTGRKRQNIAKTGNDWDYYYDSYYAQVGFPTPRLVPPMKRARLHVPPSATPRSVAKPSSPNKPHPTNNTSLADLKSYSTPDILICGNCRELFSEIEQLMEHKKTYCKLRFTCKCHMLNGCKPKSPAEEPASLLCSQCKDSFHSAWDLMVHVQAAHMLNIYQLSSVENSSGGGVGGPSPPNNGSSNSSSSSAAAASVRDLLLHEPKDENGGGGEDGRSVSVASGNINGDLCMEDSSSTSSTSSGLVHSQSQTPQHLQHNHYPHLQQQQQHLPQHHHHQQQHQYQQHQQQQQQQFHHQQQQQQQHHHHHHHRENSTSSTASSASSMNMDSLLCSPSCDAALLDNNNSVNDILTESGHSNTTITNSCSTSTSTSTSMCGTPERQMNGNTNAMMMTMMTSSSTGVVSSSGTQIGPCTTTTTTTAAAVAVAPAVPASTTTSTAAFPMEASTQTQTFQTDNPTNFDEHCALLSAMKAAEGVVGAPKHVPFTNGQPAGV